LGGQSRRLGSGFVELPLVLKGGGDKRPFRTPTGPAATVLSM
jgi:hypothetical protein